MSEARRDPDRHSRQSRFAPLGAEGQRRIAAGRVALVGCGALGTVVANGLVRAGCGLVRIVDRDFIERNNLQRQLLFDEDDIAAHRPKAVAAARRLRRIDPDVTVEPHVADLDHRTAEAFLGGVDVIVDGTDNFETRLLVNDFAVKHGVPWVYGGCVGAEGQTMVVRPGVTACLACVMDRPPPAATQQTCETAGILSPASGLVGNLQVMETLKLLAGAGEAVNDGWTVFDLWTNRFRTIGRDGLKRDDCRCCGRREFVWLSGRAGSHTTRLCGRNAVQVVPDRQGRREIDLAALRERLPDADAVAGSDWLLRFLIDGCEFSVFRDGRAIVKGTEDVTLARTLYARHVGL